MILRNLAIPTGVVTVEDPLKKAFEICTSDNVPGIPVVDQRQGVIGRLSLRDVYRRELLPSHIVQAAHLLGDGVHRVNIPKVDAHKMLQRPVGDFVLANYNSATSDSPVIKGLAIMEQAGSGYLFVIDDGVYQGVVTRMGISKRLVELAGNGGML